MIEVALAAILGAAWRWWDGRGLGIYPSQTKFKGGTRHFVCGVLVSLILMPNLYAILAMGIPFVAMWVPRQKQREEIDDMMLRWAVPMVAIGLVGNLIAIFSTGINPHAWAVMGVSGVLMALIVWASVRFKYEAPHPWVDGDSVACALTGALAFGSLAYAV